MKQKRWCGLNAKEGTIMAGLFMMMVSIMQLIFDVGNFRYLKPPFTSDSTNNRGSSLQIFTIGSTVLTCLTIVAVILLFLAIWKEIFWGVAGYITWIFLNELSNICLMSFLLPELDRLPKSMRALEWFGLITRLLSHIFWMMFVTSHAINLYKVSRNTDDPLKNERKTPPKLKFAKVKELGV
ncbi:transmembrane protein 217-like [Cetorhinus maximus]